MKSLASLLLALAACSGGSRSPAPAPPPTPVAGGECEVGGCSGTACTEPGRQVMTTCEYRAEYACYQSASCERQTDGTCGWTQSPDLVACLANPPPTAGPPTTPQAPADPTPTATIAPNPL
jgi:hypothetical protein